MKPIITLLIVASMVAMMIYGIAYYEGGIHYPGYDEYVVPCDTDQECMELNPHLGKY